MNRERNKYFLSGIHRKSLQRLDVITEGNMDIAREMIMTAAMYCKVDVVKFQKRKSAGAFDKRAI